jgi:tetratricopeptide (TPR) repeat protein
LLYKQALAIDSDYTEAWVGLAESYIAQAIEGSLTREDARLLAIEALEHALTNDPELASAHRNLGRASIVLENDLSAAAAHYTRALLYAPGNLDILRDSAQLLMALGRFESALRVIDYVVGQDPLNPLGHHRRGDIFYFSGRFAYSVESYRNAWRVVPGFAGAQSAIAYALAQSGDVDGALQAVRSEPSSAWRRPIEPYVLLIAGRSDEGEAALREVMADPAGWESAVASAQIVRSDVNSAFEWLERAVSNGSQTSLYEIAWDPSLTTLHSDPRWPLFLRKLGMAPEQLAAIKFDVKLPQQ